MCHQERSSLIAIAISLLVNAYALLRLEDLFSSGALSGPDAPMVWAKMIVWVVPTIIGLTLLVHLVLVASSRRRQLNWTTDERDRLFQLRGICVTVGAFGVGLVTAMIGLSMGWAPLTAFLTIYYLAAIGDVAGNAVRIAHYRLGA